MTRYIAGAATYYYNTWHIDPATESKPLDEVHAIEAGHALLAQGHMMILYTEYTNGTRGHVMIEYNGSLECAYGM